MADAAEKVLDEALKLPADVERAWMDEAQRRLDDVREGRAKVVPWEQARSRIFDRS
jgi:putative addiction module component (TIGR02574 family)